MPHSYRQRAFVSLRKATQLGRISPSQIRQAVGNGDVGIAQLMASHSTLPAIPNLRAIQTPQIPLIAGSQAEMDQLVALVRELEKRGLIADFEVHPSENPYCQLLRLAKNGLDEISKDATAKASAIATCPSGRGYVPISVDVPLLSGIDSHATDQINRITIGLNDTPFIPMPELGSPMANLALRAAIRSIATNSVLGMFQQPKDSMQMICMQIWEGFLDLLPHTKWEGDEPAVSQAALSDFFAELGWGDGEPEADSGYTEIILEHLKYVRAATTQKAPALRSRNVSGWLRTEKGPAADLVRDLAAISRALAKIKLSRQDISYEYEGDPISIYMLDNGVEHYEYFRESLDYYGQEEIAYQHLFIDKQKNAGQFLDLYANVLLEMSLITIAAQLIAFYE